MASHAQIKANIHEIDGPYYPVLLVALPRKGELVDLSSLIDSGGGHPFRNLFEVVEVLHELQDVSDTYPGGSHSVTVLVKRSQSSYFRK